MQVLVAQPDGQVGAEIVSMFSHQQDAGFSPFVTLVMTNNDTVCVSPSHCLPASRTAHSSYAHAAPVRAAHIKAGDRVWTLTAAGMQPAEVTLATRTVMRGLYSPHVVGGALIVDGVAVFTSSEGLPHWGVNHILNHPKQLVPLGTMALLLYHRHVISSLACHAASCIVRLAHAA